MKALALFSGGLDSTLAILMMKDMGIDVTGVTFITTIGCKSKENVAEKNSKTAKRFGFGFIAHDFTEKQFEIVKNPQYGHGKQLNPCMDCHILMLKEAKKLMQEIGASFIVTGEVLGQRPKSQRRDTFPIIDRDAGLEGLVLRPLSAKIMPETTPEKEGWVDREKLLGIGGRGRKTQIDMAKSMGWEDFPSPAGGCLLTDLGYVTRLKRIIKDEKMPPENDLKLTVVGRHFEVQENRIIVGRKEDENNFIEEMADHKESLLQVQDFGSPIAIIKNTASEEIINLAAGITARYSDGKKQDQVKVRIWTKSGQERFLNISPLADEEVRKYIVG